MSKVVWRGTRSYTHAKTGSRQRRASLLTADLQSGGPCVSGGQTIYQSIINQLIIHMPTCSRVALASEVASELRLRDSSVVVTIDGIEDRIRVACALHRRTANRSIDQSMLPSIHSPINQSTNPPTNQSFSAAYKPKSQAQSRVVVTGEGVAQLGA